MLDIKAFSAWLSLRRDPAAEAERLRARLQVEYETLLQAAGVADGLENHLEHLADLRVRLAVLDDLIAHYRGENDGAG